jgi:hypothetical protein
MDNIATRQTKFLEALWVPKLTGNSEFWDPDPYAS